MISLRGFTITIFVVGGDMEDLRLVEKSGWSGKGVVCPRSLFQSAKTRKEFSGPGVYILTGPSGKSGLTQVYIGQGDPVRRRLDIHTSKKDFWTSVILFCSTNGTLNKAHLQYLEAVGARIVQEQRWGVGANQGPPIRISDGCGKRHPRQVLQWSYPLER